MLYIAWRYMYMDVFYLFVYNILLLFSPSIHGSDFDIY